MTTQSLAHELCPNHLLLQQDANRGKTKSSLCAYAIGKTQHDHTTQAEHFLALRHHYIIATFAFPSQVTPRLQPLLQNLFYSI